MMSHVNSPTGFSAGIMDPSIARRLLWSFPFFGVVGQLIVVKIVIL